MDEKLIKSTITNKEDQKEQNMKEFINESPLENNKIIIQVNNESYIDKNKNDITFNNINEYSNSNCYISPNLNYTSNTKKSINNSITVDNKIIKNLNEQNFSCNTAIKNPKKGSKNISNGIRKMLKILKLDDEDKENISENIKNLNYNRINSLKIISNKNINENCDLNINNNNNSKDNNYNDNNNKNIDLKNYININYNKSNDMDDDSQNKIKKFEIELNINQSNNSDKKSIQCLEYQNSNNIEINNINNNFQKNIEIREIKDINYIKNTNIDDVKDIKTKFSITKETNINFYENNIINKNIELLIEKNNFEINENEIKYKNDNINNYKKIKLQICSQFSDSIGNINNNNNSKIHMNRYYINNLKYEKIKDCDIILNSQKININDNIYDNLRNKIKDFKNKNENNIFIKGIKNSVISNINNNSNLNKIDNLYYITNDINLDYNNLKNNKENYYIKNNLEFQPLLNKITNKKKNNLFY